jgi:hypothetical protein
MCEYCGKEYPTQEELDAEAERNIAAAIDIPASAKPKKNKK